MKKFLILLSVFSVVTSICLVNFPLLYPEQSVPEGMSVRDHALEQSRLVNAVPNTNFYYCADANISWKTYTEYLKRRHSPEEMYHDYNYHTCINTVTGFYNPRFTAAKCSNFAKDPERWHFKEVERKNARPGDIMMLYDKEGKPWHAVIIDHFTGSDIIFNHSNGKWQKNDYKHGERLSRWRNKYSILKFYTYFEAHESIK